MDQMMGLVVGWTLVGGFIFTMIITLGSLVGLVKFVNPKQQQALFAALIVEVVVGVGAKAAGVSYNPAKVAKDVKQAGANEAVTEVLNDILPAGEGPTPGAPVSRDVVKKLLQRIRVNPGSPLEESKRIEVERLEKLPSPDIDAKGAAAVRNSALFKDAVTRRVR